MNVPFEREREIFEAVLDCPEHERESYLSSACGDDAALRRGVQSLIDALTKVDTLFGEPDADADGEKITPEVPGTILGDYELGELIGEGAMGLVYRARQLRPLQREVALKIIRPGLDTRHAIARFEMERQALAAMEHPGIAKVFDAGMTAAGRPYFVMEFIHGVPITQFCKDRALSVEARAKLFLKVCAAVEHAHQKAIVHRDLKPSNVLVAEREGEAQPVVIDFGIAKRGESGAASGTLLTRDGHLMGTPDYMAPEQAAGGEGSVDTRADVYSLGVLLFELLTGRPPFSSHRLTKQTHVEMARIICDEPPKRPSRAFASRSLDERQELAGGTRKAVERWRRQIEGDLDWIVWHALEKAPEARYPTVHALADDVRRQLEKLPVSARPPSLGYQAGRFVRRHKAATFATALVCFAIGVGTTISVIQTRRAQQAERVAEAELRRSQKVTDFLLGVLKVESRGENTSKVRLEEVLVDAAEKIPQMFGDDPGVTSDLFVALGASQSALGNFEKAVSLGERAQRVLAFHDLSSNRRRGAAVVLTMTALDRLDRHRESQVLGREALFLSPMPRQSRRTLHLRIAKSLGYEGRHEEAIAEYEGLLQERHGDAPPSKSMQWTMEVELAEQEMKLQRHASAIGRLRRLVDSVPLVFERLSDPVMRANVFLAKALDENGASGDAVALLEGIVQMVRGADPAKKLAFYQGTAHLARMYQLLGRVASPGDIEALLARLSVRTHGSGVAPEPGLIGDQVLLYEDVHLAALLEAAGRSPEILKHLEPSLTPPPAALDPSQPIFRIAHHLLATSYLETGRGKDAIRVLEKILAWERALNTRTPEYAVSLARAYLIEGESEAAFQAAAQALAWADTQPTRWIELQVEAVNALTQLGRHEELVHFLEPQVPLLQERTLEMGNARGLLRTLLKAYRDTGRNEEAQILGDWLKARPWQEAEAN